MCKSIAVALNLMALRNPSPAASDRSLLEQQKLYYCGFISIALNIAPQLVML
jgi:hypothetical protein